MYLCGKIKVLRSSLHNEHHKLAHTWHTSLDLKATLHAYQLTVKQALKRAESESAAAIGDEARTQKDAELVLDAVGMDNAELCTSLETCWAWLCALKKQARCFLMLLEAQVEKVKTRRLLFQLWQEGVYLAQA